MHANEAVHPSFSSFLWFPAAFWGSKRRSGSRMALGTFARGGRMTAGTDERARIA